MHTQRAYVGADTVLAFYVREPTGKVSFTGKTVTIRLFRYGQPRNYFPVSSRPDLTLDATSPEAGKVLATLSTADANKLGQGLYRAEVVANTAVVHDGLIEIV